MAAKKGPQQTVDLSDPKSLFEHMGKANTPRDHVTLPNGKTFLVRGLLSHEFGTLQEQIREDGELDFNGAPALYMIYGTLNPDGTQAFSDTDVGKIMAMPRALIQPLVDKIIDLTGVSPDANKRLAKNWSRMTASGSCTESPATSESTPGK